MSFTTKYHKVKFHHWAGGTDCTIGVVQPSLESAKPTFVPLYVGHAKLSQYDQFNKNIGRKIALSRALRNIERDKRKEFWEAYFTMRNGKF